MPASVVLQIVHLHSHIAVLQLAFIHSSSAITMASVTWVKCDTSRIQLDVGNPHKHDTAAHGKYEQIKWSTTVGEAKKAGASAWDLSEYHKKNKLRVLDVAEGKSDGLGGGGGVASKSGKGQGKGEEAGVGKQKGEEGGAPRREQFMK